MTVKSNGIPANDQMNQLIFPACWYKRLSVKYPWIYKNFFPLHTLFDKLAHDRLDCSYSNNLLDRQASMSFECFPQHKCRAAPEAVLAVCQYQNYPSFSKLWVWCFVFATHYFSSHLSQFVTMWSCTAPSSPISDLFLNILYMFTEHGCKHAKVQNYFVLNCGDSVKTFFHHFSLFWLQWFH